jgi:hypothetical protein
MVERKPGQQPGQLPFTCDSPGQQWRDIGHWVAWWAATGRRVVAKLKSEWMETTGGRSVCIVLYMSMSLDGYIADPNDFLGGDDDHRLHN